MYIYKFVNTNNEILYIGKSVDVIRRIWSHNITKQLKDIEYTVCYIRIDNPIIISLLELYLINKYKPVYNKDSKYENYEYFNIDLDLQDKNWRILSNSTDEQITKYSEVLYSTDESNYAKFKYYINENYKLIPMKNRICANVNNKKNSLSFNSLMNNEEEITRLSKNITNLFINYVEPTSYKNKIWTSDFLFKNLINFGNGLKRFEKSWKNIADTSISENINTVAIVSNLYKTEKIAKKEDSDKYALHLMLNFLYNIKPEEGNKILLYIASNRMHEILTDFLK